jgi:hypothetical protein
MKPHVWLSGAVNAALGSEKTYPIGTPEGVETPYVIFERTGTGRDPVLSDPLGEPAAGGSLPSVAEFSLEVYADGYVEVWDLADAIVSAIDGRATEDGLLQCWVEDASDGAPAWLDGHSLPTYTVQMKVQITYVPG